MKNLILCFSLLMVSDLIAQNIQALYENLPLPAKNCEDALKTAELEWEQLVLDNDSIFNRIKSWAPGGELKNFAIRTEKLQAYIDRSSENNSFSLSAPTAIDKETMGLIEILNSIRSRITSKWNVYRDPVTQINANFIVPNELEYGCDQMVSSIQILNSVSEKLLMQLSKFNQEIHEDLVEFQTRFDELNKIKNPMVNNQILDETTQLISILNEILNTLNFHYKNMVETRMAWHNAFCK